MQSEQLNELAAALVKAQGTLKNATLNKTNPHFKSKYADLAGIRDTVTATLAANGLALTQTVETVGDQRAVRTTLLHTSGQWIASDILLPPVADMQKLGSAITYARRYGLSAICGIAADEDDDGNAASEPERPKADPAYDNWLLDLEQVAIDGDGQALLDTVKKSKAEFRDRLRADVRTWNALKAKAAKGQAA